MARFEPDVLIKNISSFISKLNINESSNESVYTDIYDYSKEYIIYIDLPGCNKSNISIDLNDDILTIKAYRDAPDNYTNCIVNERPKTFKEKTLKLPSTILDSTPNVTYEKGVLKLIFKKNSKSNKSIPIF